MYVPHLIGLAKFRGDRYLIGTVIDTPMMKEADASGPYSWATGSLLVSFVMNDYFSAEIIAFSSFSFYLRERPLKHLLGIDS
jgi:hypothetical protein